MPNQYHVAEVVDDKFKGVFKVVELDKGNHKFGPTVGTFSDRKTAEQVAYKLSYQSYVDQQKDQY